MTTFLPSDPVAAKVASANTLNSNFGERIVVHHYSKIITCFPTMVVAFACAALSAWCVGNVTAQERIATFFLATLGINLIILSLEFPHMTALFTATLITLMVVILLWLGLLRWVLGFALSFHWIANAQFYLAVGILFSLLYALVWITSRFDYWEFTPNDVIHYRLGDRSRFPAPGLRVDVEIADVVEYAMLGGGRLILRPSSERQAVVIEVVLNVRKVEREIKHLLRAMEVRVEAPHVHDDGTASR